MDRLSCLLIVIMIFIDTSSAATQIKLRVRCDDAATAIYVDGVLYGTTQSYDEVWEGEVPEHSYTLAVSCYNDVDAAGLIVYASNGAVSQPAWRCGTTYHKHWVQGSYSQYIHAIDKLQYQNNGTSPDWPMDERFPPEAFWLQPAVTQENTTMYCKGPIGPVVIHITCPGPFMVTYGFKHYYYTAYGTFGTYVLQYEPTTFAVTCVGNKTLGGIMVSSSTGFKTDSTWMCTTVYDKTMLHIDYNEAFDVVEWDPAYVIETNENSSVAPPNPLFAGDAKWIWHDKFYEHTNERTTCRKSFGHTVLMNSTAYSSIYFAESGNSYSVGRNQPDNTNNLTTVMPRSTQVITVRAPIPDDPEKAGILVSTSTGFVSDTRWRCSLHASDQWYGVEYHDLAWDTPVALQKPVPETYHGAQWIWHRDATNLTDYVYCRGHFECGCSHTCFVHADTLQRTFQCRCPDGMILKDELTCVEPETMSTTTQSTTTPTMRSTSSTEATTSEGYGFDAQDYDDDDDGNDNDGAVIALAVILAVVVLCLIVLAICFLISRKKWKAHNKKTGINYVNQRTYSEEPNHQRVQNDRTLSHYETLDDSSLQGYQHDRNADDTTNPAFYIDLH